MRKDGTKHKVLRVTLSNGEQYAVDFTGAQYGYKEDCQYWEDYREERVEGDLEVRPLGSTEKWYVEKVKEKPQEGGYPFKEMLSIKYHFANELKRSLEIWVKKEGSIDCMLTLPDEEYEGKSKLLLEWVKSSMKIAREVSIRKGRWSRK